MAASLTCRLAMCLGHSEAGRDIVKPASFKTQEFKRIVLDNGIEFVLVSDAELDKAGASIDVSMPVSCFPCFCQTPRSHLKSCAEMHEQPGNDLTPSLVCNSPIFSSASRSAWGACQIPRTLRGSLTSVSTCSSMHLPSTQRRMHTASLW